VSKQVIYDPNANLSCFDRILKRLNIDRLSELEDGPGLNRDTQTLMK